MWDRSDKEYCGATCRKRWSRRGDRAKRAYTNILLDLNSIRATIKKHPDLRDDLNEKLKRIKGEVIDVLRLTDKETITEQAAKSDLVGGMRESRHYLTPAEARKLSEKAGM